MRFLPLVLVLLVGCSCQRVRIEYVKIPCPEPQEFAIPRLPIQDALATWTTDDWLKAYIESTAILAGEVKRRDAALGVYRTPRALQPTAPGPQPTPR